MQGNIFAYVPDISGAKRSSAAIFRLIDSKAKIDASNPEGTQVDKPRGQVVLKE